MVGKTLGHYEILEPLGKGGMGEVYRARDTKLDRDVAIKVLPEDFADDPDRLARLEREAKLLAALNHPHIATIYSLEEVGEARFLVLELIKGESLAQQLAKGPLPVERALEVCKQVAEALESAHAEGIIHRDLKPANVLVTPDDRAKVLDFGIAKSIHLGAAVAETAKVTNLTVAGTLVGTPSYMSPEQVRGEDIDKRADNWAFGCVLYETLTGRSVFGKETLADTLVAILEQEPDWDRLPPVHPRIRLLLERCLEKKTGDRCHDIGDARVDLQKVLQDPHVGSAETTAATVRSAPRRMAAQVAASIILTAILVGVAIWNLTPASLSSGGEVTRATLALPATQELDVGGGAHPLAISPNGRRLVYAASSEGMLRLFSRNLDSFETQPIEGSEGAQYPFFSPDGSQVAFFADGKLLRVSIGGGRPIEICAAPTVGRGGTWGADGTIVFDPGRSGLMQVSAEGGTPQPLTSQNPEIDAQDHTWPRFVADGRLLLSSVGATLIADGVAQLAVLTRDTGEWRLLGPGSQAQYLPSGHLLYHAGSAKEGEIRMVEFDLDTLAAHGAPIPVLDGVFRASNGGAAYFAVADNGTLVFAPGGLAHTLVEVDRGGRRTPLLDDRRGFRHPRLSPDGRRLALTVDPRPSQIWVYDIERGTRILLEDDRHNMAPVWTPDGRRVAYRRMNDIFWRPADGSGEAQPLVARPDSIASTNGWSADGRWFLFQVEDPMTGWDIWGLPTDGEPEPLIATAANEMHGAPSSDGRWLAYSSDETGRFEVYVRPFPNVDDGKSTISTDGGQSPRWSPDGRELFYMKGAELLAVPVEIREDTFVPGAPEALFDGPFDTTQDHNFDVFPDGESFVMVEADPDARPSRINVVLNWFEELKQRVPGGR